MPESRAVGTSPPEKQADKRQNKPANKHDRRRIQQTTGITISAAWLHNEWLRVSTPVV